jgi:glutamate carboxypeptidase
LPAITPVLVVNADEEIGSGDSERLIRAPARGAERARVLEGGEGDQGRPKIARKGVGRYELTIRGRAAHAGTSFDQGISAIFELSQQIQSLFAPTIPSAGSPSAWDNRRRASADRRSQGNGEHRRSRAVGGSDARA